MKNNFITKIKGFSLAEVLLVLAVLGVVAAITIPVVIRKYKDEYPFKYAQKARTTIADPGRRMAVDEKLLGYKDSEDFVVNGLSKYVKMGAKCSYSNKAACGFPEKINGFEEKVNDDFSKWSSILPRGLKSNSTNPDNITSYVFKTTDGFSVLLFYNPYCTHKVNKAHTLNSKEQYALDLVCYNAIYDMNGLKGPNKVGTDIGFVSLINNDTQAVGVNAFPYDNDFEGNYEEVLNACGNIEKVGKWTLPTDEELASLYVNAKLVGNMYSNDYWASNSPVGSNGMKYFVSFNEGYRGSSFVDVGKKARCIKRN